MQKQEAMMQTEISATKGGEPTVIWGTMHKHKHKSKRDQIMYYPFPLKRT